MKLWIERDYGSGHLLVHTTKPVRVRKHSGSTFWVDKDGNCAKWKTHLDIDIPFLKLGDVAEFILSDVLTLEDG